MARRMCTAVAAVAEYSVEQRLLQALSSANLELCHLARDGFSALDALEKHRPDLLIADMQLPGMEGSALVLRTVCTFRLPVRPAAILLHYPQFPIPDQQMLEQADVVLLEKPFSPSEFASAAEKLRCSPPRFLPKECAQVDRLLDELGFPSHAGRSCLRAAILLGAADERLRHRLNSDLYPLAGEICSLSAAQAECAMRHAIDLAWQSNQFDNQYRIFADTIDAGRGQPTCGQMISRLADILRLEG